MHRAYIMGLIMLTLISAVSCSTVSPQDISSQAPAADEAGNETQDEAAQSSSDLDTDFSQSEPAAEEPEAVLIPEIDLESEIEAESEPKPSDDVPAAQNTSAEKTETAAAEVASPEATLPDSIPPERQDAARFLMLSPQIDVSSVLPESESAGNRVASRSEERPAQPPAPTEPRDEPDTDEDNSREDNSREDESGEDPAGADSRTEQQPEQQPETAQAEMDVVRAGKGEEVHLSLPGFGWIYDRDSSQSNGLEFLSRSYAQSATEFVFSAGDVGRYTLAFQQQDSSSGRSSEKRIAVEVSRQSVQDRIPSQAAGSDETNEEFAAPDGGRSPNLQLPSFSFERLESAVLARNANDTAQQVQALLLSRGSGGSSDLQPAAAGQAAFSDAQRKLLVEAGEVLVDSEREMLAEQVLKFYLRESGETAGDSRGDGEEHSGRVLYLLGRIYESPPPPRDERQSVEYYRRIVNFYPTDPYRRRAEERIKYLQRHFLQIR